MRRSVSLVLIILGIAILGAVTITTIFVIIGRQPNEERCKAALKDAIRPVVHSAVVTGTPTDTTNNPAECQGLTRPVLDRLVDEAFTEVLREAHITPPN